MIQFREFENSCLGSNVFHHIFSAINSIIYVNFLNGHLPCSKSSTLQLLPPGELGTAALEVSSLRWVCLRLHKNRQLPPPRSPPKNRRKNHRNKERRRSSPASHAVSWDTQLDPFCEVEVSFILPSLVPGYLTGHVEPGNHLPSC